jgi:hypothetical protein
MAKPIAATPVVTGTAAEKIFREIRSGTPDTPTRVEWTRDADDIYRRANERSGNKAR